MSAVASPTGRPAQLPRRRSQLWSSLSAGKKQHRRRNVDSDQASRTAIDQLVQPPACTAARIKNVQAANIRQPAPRTAAPAKAEGLAGCHKPPPSYQTPRAVRGELVHKLSRFGLRRLMKLLAHWSSTGKL